ncbi:hypothetical protein [Mycobacterium sp.]|uniref:hypothetical protein n=1 Tax=Mycobacterium sp. TaxID=1785 RepID=UPI003F9AB876
MTTIYFATNHATAIPLMQDAYRGELDVPHGRNKTASGVANATWQKTTEETP